jgi:predicted secreted acid phosphatase
LDTGEVREIPGRYPEAVRKTVLFLSLACAVVICAQTRPAAPAFTPTVGAPELHLQGDNLEDVKETLYRYAQSGQYVREITRVVAAAHDWLETRAASATPNQKLAAVFDIDETALSNLPYILDCGFCSDSAQARIYPTDRLQAIPPVLDLYNYTKSKGITPIFITGRYERVRDLTVRNLETSGFKDWAELSMRPEINTDSAHVFKAGVRAELERKGYKIVLNIGDQMSDLSGGFSERTYKLPNPFYFRD